jgi:CRP-like cAMP-binding protein
MLEDQASQANGSHTGTPFADARSKVNPRVSLVQQFPLFSEISLVDCTTIVSLGFEKQFARRQMIFLEGDPCAQVWLLMSGYAKVTQFGQNGTEVILRVAGPGDVVGALGAASRRQSSTAQALEPCRMLFWDATLFESLSARVPMLRRNVTRILQDRLRDIEERFREASTEKVASRLSSQLVRLAAQIGRRQTEAIAIGLSQQELAQLTGTTLFTVSRLLAEWERRGTVKTGREMVSICDLGGLTTIAEAE